MPQQSNPKPLIPTGADRIILGLLVALCAFPPTRGTALTALPCLFLSSVLAVGIYRSALFFALLPTVNVALTLPLVLAGLFTVPNHLLACAALTAASARLNWKYGGVSRVSYNAQHSGIAQNGRATVLSALPIYLTLLVCLSAGAALSVCPWAMNSPVAGHLCGIQDGGLYIARNGAFPFLDIGRIGHHNDHLFYNPLATLLSATCHLHCADADAARQTVYCFPVFALTGFGLGCLALSAAFSGSFWPGFLCVMLCFNAAHFAYTAWHLTHDLFLPCYTATFIVAAAEGMKSRRARDALTTGILLAGAGFVRPYLHVIFLAAAGTIILARMIAFAARRRRADAHLRLTAAILCIALVAGSSWNAIMWAKYGSPLFPHVRSLGRAGARVSLRDADARGITNNSGWNFFAGTAPGYGSARDSLRGAIGLYTTRHGVFDVLKPFRGAAMPPVAVVGLLFLLATPARRRLRGDPAGQILILCAMFSLTLCLMGGYAYQFNPKLILPFSVAGNMLGAAGLARIGRAISEKASRSRIAAARATPSALGTILVIGLGFSPMVRSATILLPGRGPGLTSAERTLEWTLSASSFRQSAAIARQLRESPDGGDGTLVCFFSQPADMPLYLLHKKYFWEYPHYESPECMDLHFCRTPGELEEMLDRLRIRTILTGPAASGKWNAVVAMWRARGAPEILPALIESGKGPFRPVTPGDWWIRAYAR
ncbi:MAG TPA: hypothetical protein PL033_05240 [Candidatus Brocadiia bacterium]|nr:hypothetical protein [Candidatus Brocadiia bacterium]